MKNYVQMMYAVTILLSVSSCIYMAETSPKNIARETARSACDLLQTAADEAVMAPAWHRQAGEVLQACGQPEARAAAEVRACYASARDGHRDRAECDAL